MQSHLKNYIIIISKIKIHVIFFHCYLCINCISFFLSSDTGSLLVDELVAASPLLSIEGASWVVFWFCSSKGSSLEPKRVLKINQKQKSKTNKNKQKIKQKQRKKSNQGKKQDKQNKTNNQTAVVALLPPHIQLIYYISRLFHCLVCYTISFSKMCRHSLLDVRNANINVIEWDLSFCVYWRL